MTRTWHPVFRLTLTAMRTDASFSLLSEPQGADMAHVVYLSLRLLRIWDSG